MLGGNEGLGLGGGHDGELNRRRFAICVQNPSQQHLVSITFPTCSYFRFATSFVRCFRTNSLLAKLPATNTCLMPVNFTALIVARATSKMCAMSQAVARSSRLKLSVDKMYGYITYIGVLRLCHSLFTYDVVLNDIGMVLYYNTSL